MNPVNFNDTWSQETNPHPDALRLRDLAGSECTIWETESVSVYHAIHWYMLIGESERSALWYTDGGQLEFDHGSHVRVQLNKDNRPVIATLRKNWLYGLYLE